MKIRKIGVIGAMQIEVEALIAEMTEKTLREIAGMHFCEGLLCGFPAVVVRCGIGKVNAAICAQILADLYGVDALINTGVAGSLDAKINIGDIVVASDLIQHDMDVASLGYAPGQIPGMPVLAFEAEEALNRLVSEVNEKVNPDLRVFLRRIVSGDQFIAGNAVKAHLVETFAPGCTEMEGAAIAQVAYLNKLPFTVIRAISDKADDSAEMDYPTFERMAAANSIRLVEGLMQALAQRRV